nr:uncharacterized protein LOC127485989 [Oryctolagus cuniculus]
MFREMRGGGGGPRRPFGSNAATPTGRVRDAVGVCLRRSAGSGSFLKARDPPPALPHLTRAAFAEAARSRVRAGSADRRCGLGQRRPPPGPPSAGPAPRSPWQPGRGRGGVGSASHAGDSRGTWCLRPGDPDVGPSSKLDVSSRAWPAPPPAMLALGFVPKRLEDEDLH